MTFSSPYINRQTPVQVGITYSTTYTPQPIVPPANFIGTYIKKSRLLTRDWRLETTCEHLLHDGHRYSFVAELNGSHVVVRSIKSINENKKIPFAKRFFRSLRKATHSIHYYNGGMFTIDEFISKWEVDLSTVDIQYMGTPLMVRSKEALRDRNLSSLLEGIV